ncbi:EXS domain-containing protein [Aspergillus puulaauensis]|uniref:Protein-ER retention protein n=1 Tax=Aspergillus puulaauensis TaxID=1220207 RepID=A0A7R7XN58_9EURO|nr:protein-ER retention protein [Aspergillus puulaauensis]BCS24616.1 protein-ER retention protein [Aspergillus puulaauensis]
MGPDQRAHLDGFSLFLPFPSRVAVILLAGFWGWGANIHRLQQHNIDLLALIRYRTSQSSNQRPPHVSTYRFAGLLTFPLLLSLLIFWPVTHGSREWVETVDYIPQAYLFILFVLLLLPLNRLARSGRRRFLATLRRISIGGLAEPQDGKFGDILLADALTSYAKVIADLVVTFCMFFSSDTSSTSKPDRHCGSDYVVPLVIALPSMIRLRQCLIEYVRVRRTSSKNGGSGGQHLANALKYATAFPVIALAAKLRNYSPFLFYGISEVTLNRLLYFFTLINSSYSFYWDITKDWDLTLFSEARNDNEYPFGLRRYRHFTDQQYYMAIAIDFAIRFSWMTKFFPGFSWLSDTEFGLFLLMFLEVARRWMWVFLRAEAEWIRNSRGPAPHDVLLGEYNGKLDAD